MKPEIASATIPRIKDLFIVFQFWYFFNARQGADNDAKSGSIAGLRSG